MKSVKVLLKFPVAETGKPITWMFATEYGLRFSILQADIKSDRGGKLIMDLQGEPDNIEKALEFARKESVEVSVLSRTVYWDDSTCVRCGACTAVCTSKALRLDPVTAELTFDNEKCIVCEMCTHACPTGAMKVDLFE